MKMKKRQKEVRDGDAVMKTCLQNLSSTQKHREPECTMLEKSLLLRCLSFFLLEPFPLCCLYREASLARSLVIQLPLGVGQWRAPEKDRRQDGRQVRLFFSPCSLLQGLPQADRVPLPMITLPGRQLFPHLSHSYFWGPFLPASSGLAVTTSREPARLGVP